MTALGLWAAGRLGLAPQPRRRRPRAFAPDQLSGLAFWYDAATSPTVVTGGAIERWDDLSGNANHASQATASRRPTKTTDAAGRTLLRFDGSDDVLGVATPPSLAAGVTVFVVFRMRTRVDFRGILAASAATGADHQQFFTFQNASAASQQFQVSGKSAQGPGGEAVVATPDSTETQYAILTFDDDDVELRDLNGVKGDTTTAVAFGTPAAIVLGGRYNNGAPFNFGAVDLYEVGLYPRTLTTDERASLETYLKQRHGLAWNPMHIGLDLRWYHDALTSAFTLSGGLVDQWSDRSSAARHWVQTGAARPTKTQDGAGLPVVRFDGVDDVLTMGGTLPALEPFSVAAVYRLRTREDFVGIVSAAASSGADHAAFWTFQCASATSNQVQVFGRSLEVGAAQLLMARPDGGATQIAIWAAGGGSAELRDRNGSLTDAYGGGFGTPASIVLGGRYNGAPTLFAEIDVYATVGVGRVLSAADQQRLIDWAAAAWNV